MSGLYIHLPFCASRCIYCGFYSTTHAQLASRYIDAVCREMTLRQHELSGPPATVYLGGGTPSQVPVGDLQRLTDHIYKVWGTPAGEVTMEVNPDDVTPELAHWLGTGMANRVSMGAQTFSDSRLRFLRRRHTASQVGRAVELLRRHGIANISLDLMFGFPGETLPEWEADLEAVVALRPSHVSAYSLMIEEGTALHRMMGRDGLEELDEETSRAMYYAMKDRLERAGYEHYEISNFALPGHRSRHNSSYWQGTPYVGLGAAAHSYAPAPQPGHGTARRTWNLSDIGAYMAAIEAGQLPSEGEELDGEEQYNDMIVTALRTREGISLEATRRHFAPHLAAHLEREAERQARLGLLAKSHDGWRLTREGLYVSDGVMAALMYTAD